MASFLGWPNAAELPRGRQLLGRILGRCRLVLHGHRHVPAEFHLSGPGVPPLQVVNAGSTTELARARVFCHEDGELMWQGWLEADAAVAGRLPAPDPGQVGLTAAA